MTKKKTTIIGALIGLIIGLYESYTFSSALLCQPLCLEELAPTYLIVNACSILAFSLLGFLIGFIIEIIKRKNLKT